MPIFTSGMSQAQALRALGIKKFVGCTYYRDQKMNDIFTRYLLTLDSRFWAWRAWTRHRTRRTKFYRDDLSASQSVIQQISDGAGHLFARLRRLECQRYHCGGKRSGGSRGSSGCRPGLVRAKAFESQKSVEGSEPITGGIALAGLTELLNSALRLQRLERSAALERLERLQRQALNPWKSVDVELLNR